MLEFNDDAYICVVTQIQYNACSDPLLSHGNLYAVLYIFYAYQSMSVSHALILLAFSWTRCNYSDVASTLLLRGKGSEHA